MPDKNETHDVILETPDRNARRAEMSSGEAPPSASTAGPALAEPDHGLGRVERDVLLALADGHTVAEIARSLRISERTVNSHLAQVLAKLHRQHAARSEVGRPRG